MFRPRWIQAGSSSSPKEGEMLEPHRLLPHLELRPLKLSLCAMLGGLLLLCVKMVLLQVGPVEAQGTLDVCPGCVY